MTIIERINHLLNDHFAPLHLDIRDDSEKHSGHSHAKKNPGIHLHIKMTSEKFKDKTPIQKHKLVYDILDPYLNNGDIHALGLILKSP